MQGILFFAMLIREPNVPFLKGCKYARRFCCLHKGRRAFEEQTCLPPFCISTRGSSRGTTENRITLYGELKYFSLKKTCMFMSSISCIFMPFVLLRPPSIHLSFDYLSIPTKYLCHFVLFSLHKSTLFEVCAS